MRGLRRRVPVDGRLVDAIERRGRSVRCRVTFTPLRDGDKVNGAIVLMDEVS